MLLFSDIFKLNSEHNRKTILTVTQKIKRFVLVSFSLHLLCSFVFVPSVRTEWFSLCNVTKFHFQHFLILLFSDTVDWNDSYLTSPPCSYPHHQWKLCRQSLRVPFQIQRQLASGMPPWCRYPRADVVCHLLRLRPRQKERTLSNTRHVACWSYLDAYIDTHTHSHTPRLTLSLWLFRGWMPDSVCQHWRWLLLWVYFRCHSDLAWSFGFMSWSGSWSAQCVWARWSPLQNT